MSGLHSRHYFHTRVYCANRKRRIGEVVPRLVLILGSLTMATATVTAQPSTCAPLEEGEPIFIDADCEDPRFNNPDISDPELRQDPVSHYYLRGSYPGTDARFTITCPMIGSYQRRIFQNTHPLYNDNETGFPEVTETDIAFGVASGACFVRTNMGGAEQSRSTEDTQKPGFDAALGGYRVNAAAMKDAKYVARMLYGDHDLHAYLYGGSGGAYQTLCSSQQTDGVWHGYVPFVMGSPHAIPNMYTPRIHALRILKQRNKFPEIMDAIDPGGSGDPYATLNEEESEALREATRMGFPPLGWWSYESLDAGALSLIAGYVPILDPTYTDDFFSKPGYLGFDDPYGSVAAARIQDQAGDRSVGETHPLPNLPLIVLDSIPEGDLVGSDLYVDTGGEAGKAGTVFVTVPELNAVFALGLDPENMAPGDQVRLDNSGNLALQTYHRHQVPDPEFYVWKQFRNGRAGKPKYPQRDVLIGPIGAYNGAGCDISGDFEDKMIVVQNLLDIDALPWGGDWFKKRAKRVQRGKGSVNQRFRLWFTEHAQHTSPAPDNTAAFARTISYAGVLQHAVRDLAAWVEDGTRPPPSTKYRVANGQVIPKRSAQTRMGIQPVVQLTVNGGERADVKVGEEVQFKVVIEVPRRAGSVVAAEWDFEGIGNFDDGASDHNDAVVIIERTHSYDLSGTYFPVVRGTSQRESNPDHEFARPQNLGRVRVVVTE